MYRVTNNQGETIMICKADTAIEAIIKASRFFTGVMYARKEA